MDIVAFVSWRALITSDATNQGAPSNKTALIADSDSNLNTDGIFLVVIAITFVVRLITTRGANLRGGETYRVCTTGYKGPGQPFGCPARPTIMRMWPCLTHKKTACAVDAPL